MPIGTVVGVIGLLARIGLGAFISRVAYVALERRPMVASGVVFFLAVVAAAGGLVIFWETAEQVDFWRRGYRVRQLSPKGLSYWALGPKQFIYEERTRDGCVQGLRFVRIVLGGGYPMAGEIRLPGEDNWDAQMPSWARGRRKEIINCINECFGLNAPGRIS